jgi:hypothetical protein
LFLVWVIEILHQSGGVSVSILGASIQIAGLWQIVPLIATFLVLCIAGSLNLTQHAWRRLNLCLTAICEEDVFSSPNWTSTKHPSLPWLPDFPPQNIDLTGYHGGGGKQTH